MQVLLGLGSYQAGEIQLLLVIEHCQLCDADVREVLRTESEEAPKLRIHRFQRELMLEIQVFLLQFIIVFIGTEKELIEQTCLTEEDGLNLKKTVTMLANGLSYTMKNQYMVYIPGIVLCLAALSINTLGDCLRDALDPRLKK